ncbi:hypothetical protein (nucleomorph) [Guillardia theta]|uniref:Uncharacterized protein n=1 Tax=Guillardia theta TaxID=55529 RepID=Q98RS0_GUITH|nr:hypothetical protein GTHECHR1085 [Guillardia theta]AAK39877.1 hypothetical protein [Guillardia theta]|mmetsp:Transcript_40486/g.127484  ORF Transcript_40486/g.127484 Transcript_40486/m.127484 type:complete len:101 (+) Transcript_40486:1066-1368(+)
MNIEQLKTYLKKHVNEFSKNVELEVSSNFSKEFEIFIENLLLDLSNEALKYCENNEFGKLSEYKLLDMLQNMGYHRFCTDLVEEILKKKKEDLKHYSFIT